MELTIMNFNGIETVDSRHVAEAIGKPHNDLMKDIRRYSGFLNEGRISPVDFLHSLKRKKHGVPEKSVQCWVSLQTKSADLPMLTG